MLFCEGLRILARTRKLVRLLLRRKATIGADLKTLWQRWNEVKTLACLRMMDEVERRAHPCSLFFSFVFKKLADQILHQDRLRLSCFVWLLLTYLNLLIVVISES